MLAQVCGSQRWLQTGKAGDLLRLAACLINTWVIPLALDSERHRDGTLSSDHSSPPGSASSPGSCFYYVSARSILFLAAPTIDISRTHTHTHIQMYIYKLARTHIYTHARTHPHTHNHAQTHIHTRCIHYRCRVCRAVQGFMLFKASPQGALCDTGGSLIKSFKDPDKLVKTVQLRLHLQWSDMWMARFLSFSFFLLLHFETSILCVSCSIRDTPVICTNFELHYEYFTTCNFLFSVTQVTRSSTKHTQFEPICLHNLASQTPIQSQTEWKMAALSWVFFIITILVFLNLMWGTTLDLTVKHTVIG